MPWIPSWCTKEETHERCGCHVCNTLRTLLSANVGAEHDRRSPTPLLLTFKQAAELLGVGEATVRELVRDQELRAVTIQSYGRQRIPRAEIDDYVSRLLTGQLRAWVEARRDVEQWGLRYMGDRRSYTYRNGQRVARTSSWHLGDGKTTLCGADARGRWEIVVQAWYGSRHPVANRDRMASRSSSVANGRRSIPSRSSQCSRSSFTREAARQSGARAGISATAPPRCVASRGHAGRCPNDDLAHGPAVSVRRSLDSTPSTAAKPNLGVCRPPSILEAPRLTAADLLAQFVLRSGRPVPAESHAESHA